MGLLIGMIFLVSSSGYVLFKSSCSCTGNEQTTVFVKPETCEDNFHSHHKHDKKESEISCSELDCHECTTHEEDCGCETPEMFFFKLKDNAIDEEVKFVAVKKVELFIAKIQLFEKDTIDDIDKYLPLFYTDPPPKISSSLEFLIQIHKLKIPGLA